MHMVSPVGVGKEGEDSHDASYFPSDLMMVRWVNFHPFRLAVIVAQVNRSTDMDFHNRQTIRTMGD